MENNKQKKSKKEIAHRIEAILLTLSITVTGSVCIYKYALKPKLERTSTYGYTYLNGNEEYDEIYLNNDIKDLEYQAILNNIKGNKDIEQKKAEALYYAILSNDGLTRQEKQDLSNYIQYFIDNKYIDHNNVFNKLLNFKITKNDSSLLEQGIGATYNEDNSITFATSEERGYLLTHEMFHCIENENLSYENYAWFIEGYDCTVNYEYFDNIYDGESMKANFIRCLCELVEPDILFKVSATGDINHLISALCEKGVDKERIDNLIVLCEEYNCAEAFGEGDLEELAAEISYCFAEMYNIIYENPDYISDSFFHSLLRIKGEESEIYDYYYFNSVKVKNNKEKQYTRTQDELFVLMEESSMTYS